MCGIVGYYYSGKSGKRVVKERVLKALYDQSFRGEDSWGVLVCAPGKTFKRFRTTKFKKMKSCSIWDEVEPNSFVIAHNRAATSTLVHELMTHPFINESGSLAMVHNGVVTDYMEECSDLSSKGHKFETLHEVFETMRVNSVDYNTPKNININDSEVLLHHYEQYGVDAEFWELGSIAACFVDVRKSDDEHMLLVKKSNPVEYKFLDDGDFIAASTGDSSTTTANTGSVIKVSRDGSLKIVVEGEKTASYASSYSGSKFGWDKYSKQDSYGGITSGGTSPASKARKELEDMEFEESLDEKERRLFETAKSIKPKNVSFVQKCGYCGMVAKTYRDELTFGWLCASCRIEELVYVLRAEQWDSEYESELSGVQSGLASGGAEKDDELDDYDEYGGCKIIPEY